MIKVYKESEKIERLDFFSFDDKYRIPGGFTASLDASGLVRLRIDQDNQLVHFEKDHIDRLIELLKTIKDYSKTIVHTRSTEEVK